MDIDIAAKLKLPALEQGWVWLVGAGPGDPGLITALGLQALSQADYILYDALVNDAVKTAVERAGVVAELTVLGHALGRVGVNVNQIARVTNAVGQQKVKILLL